MTTLKRWTNSGLVLFLAAWAIVPAPIPLGQRAVAQTPPANPPTNPCAPESWPAEALPFVDLVCAVNAAAIGSADPTAVYGCAQPITTPGTYTLLATGGLSGEFDVIFADALDLSGADPAVVALGLNASYAVGTLSGPSGSTPLIVVAHSPVAGSGTTLHSVVPVVIPGAAQMELFQEPTAALYVNLHTFELTPVGESLPGNATLQEAFAFESSPGVILAEFGETTAPQGVDEACVAAAARWGSKPFWAGGRG